MDELLKYVETLSDDEKELHKDLIEECIKRQERNHINKIRSQVALIKGKECFDKMICNFQNIIEIVKNIEENMSDFTLQLEYEKFKIHCNKMEK